MRWGVTRENEEGGGYEIVDVDPSQTSSQTDKQLASKKKESGGSGGHSKEAYLGAAKKSNSADLSKTEKAQNLAKNEKKSFKKTLPPGHSEKKGLTDNQKKALYIGAGALAVGAIIGVAAYKGKLPKASNPNLKQYRKGLHEAKLNSWEGAGYVKASSMEREAFSVPSGETFTRFSQGVETSFSEGTYAAFGDDVARYADQFGGNIDDGIDMYRVEFTSNADMHVPDLKTVLDTLTDVQTTKKGGRPSAEDVLDTYNTLSGDSWDDSTSKKLFSALKKKGYHAIVDEMDSGVLGEKPVVIFDNSIMSKKTSTEFTSEGLKRARDAIKPLDAIKQAE